MNLLCSIVIAFSMYSRLPMPKLEWTPERMRYMLCFFPLVGAAVGGAFFLWMQYGAYLTGEGNLFAAVLVLIPVLITGGIHMDGFLDTSDALSSYKSMEEKLEIMKDSHAGAFAVISGICYGLLDFGAYSQLTLETAKILAVGFVLSRSLSGLAIVTFPMAKKSGLAASFSDMAQKRRVEASMVIYLLGCLALLLWMDLLLGAVCFLTGILVFFFCRGMFLRKFGGITGDLAGFFLQVCELSMALAVIAARNLCL